jgi:glucose-6-phosphate 1-dehydrogenase
MATRGFVNEAKREPIRRFLIFGALGDLTSRYLLPAIVALKEHDKLPAGFTVMGLARNDQTTAEFRKRLAEKLEGHAASAASAARRAVLDALEFRRADATKADQIKAAIGNNKQPVVAYLALPPSVFAQTIQALSGVLPEGSRVVIEKPFGEDLASAKRLNELLHRTLPERAVFRTDHFLHKQTVQNLLGLRFANRIFEPLWNAQHIEQVGIIWDETLTLEGRAGYYDAAGAMRDMIQNHLLQLLALVAMEAPQTLNERDLRDRKVEVLRAVRRLSAEEVPQRSIRARYTRGRIGDRVVPSYGDEPGVKPARRTESFAQVVLSIENWRWAGVPFWLRTGKALGVERKEIAIRFKPVPHLAFGQTRPPAPNVLRLDLDPDRVAVSVNINGPGDPFELEPIELAATLATQDLPAYGRLLLDVIEGDPILSIRDDEAEESWRIVEPILQTWQHPDFPLHEYPAGSGGPSVGKSRPTASALP